MKYAFLILGGLIAWTNFANSATPPTQDTVEIYISLALSIDPKVFEGQGSFYCETPFANGSDLKVYADSRQNASQLLLLKCIRFNCGKLGALVDDATQKILNQPDQVTRDFMHNLGYSEIEIENVLKQKRSKTTKYPTATCQNVSGIGRSMIVDMCIPQLCN